MDNSQKLSKYQSTVRSTFTDMKIKRCCPQATPNSFVAYLLFTVVYKVVKRVEVTLDDFENDGWFDRISCELHLIKQVLQIDNFHFSMG